ncbi:hypothetical protein [Chryseobacterium sp. MYb328]|uniref:hypothetical protein n=1 Tax=Chryseobacterium sp. MYb328 TaxID=2745231 RepID=UPI0030ADC7E2
MNYNKYYNEFFEEITEQEAGQLDHFYISYFVDGRIKKTDHISPNYFMGEYYLDATENLQEKIQELCIEGGHRWVFYTQESAAFGYTLWNSEDIGEKGNLKFKGKQVLDSKNREIFNCSIDISNGQMEEATKKYYNSDDILLLTIDYDSQNKLVYAYDKQDTWGLDGGWPMDKEELIIVDARIGAFPWDEHPYFHSAVPFLPESDCI